MSESAEHRLKKKMRHNHDMCVWGTRGVSKYHWDYTKRQCSPTRHMQVIFRSARSVGNPAARGTLAEFVLHRWAAQQ